MLFSGGFASGGRNRLLLRKRTVFFLPGAEESTPQYAGPPSLQGFLLLLPCPAVDGQGPPGGEGGKKDILHIPRPLAL